jgi:hypothetical protein
MADICLAACSYPKRPFDAKHGSPMKFSWQNGVQPRWQVPAANRSAIFVRGGGRVAAVELLMAVAWWPMAKTDATNPAQYY